MMPSASTLRVFVSPFTLFAVARLHAGCPIDGVTSSVDGGITIDGLAIVSDPDCPRNYWWPAQISKLVDATIAAALLSDAAVQSGRNADAAGWVRAIGVCQAFAAWGQL